MTPEGVGGDALDPVNTDEHDDEEEEHDDGPGVNDDLHGGQEIGLLSDEQDRDSEQRLDEHQRRVDRVAGDDHADAADEHRQRRHHEHQEVRPGRRRGQQHQEAPPSTASAAWPSSGSRTP